MSERGAFGRRMGACTPVSAGGLWEERGMGNVATAGEGKADEWLEADPGVGGWEE